MILELFLLDIKGLFTDFRVKDLGPLVFWGLWFSALLGSLRGVDRRDEIAQVTYMGVIMAIGVSLILVLPFGAKSQYGPMGKMTIFTILLVIPSLRWMYVKKRTAFDESLQESIGGKKQGKK